MNLQDLCLDVIVEDFDAYYLAYSKSDDASLKRKFEFLQRVYSFKIADLLYSNDKMKTEYVELLVNKYLKVLHTAWFIDCSWETIAAKFAEVGPNILTIHFHRDSSDKHSWQDIIHLLKNLEVMQFHHDCSDEVLKCIGQFCPKITEIDVLMSCNVTNEGMKYLCAKENGKPPCPNLKKLYIENSDVNEEGVEYLIKNLRSLEVIDFHNLPVVLYQMHESDMLNLDKIEPYNFTKLNILSLHFLPYYTNILKICLTLCPHLKVLSCHVSSQEHLDLFSGPLELEKLHLECMSTSKINVTNLLKLKGRKLTNLTVGLCSLSVSALAESCPSLEQLQLKQAVFVNEDDVTPVFHCLQTCVFDDIQTEREAIKSVSLLLRNSPKLDHIGFKKCNLESSELKTEILRCCENCAITGVNFNGSVVDINFVKDVLLNCHSLMWITLDNCNLDNEQEFELIEFAQVLPNTPDIIFTTQFNSISDDLDDDFLTSFYDFDDDYEDYDDYYDFYRTDDDDDDDDEYDVEDDIYHAYYHDL